MKKANSILGIIFVMLLWAFQGASADDLTIPNVFQPGQPARAAEVNENFDAVEASVDDNAATIASNEVAIQANSAAISGLAASGGLPVYSNGNQIGKLVSFASDSVALIQSDKGYIYKSGIAGTVHLDPVTLYYSDSDCIGTLYVRAGPGGALEWAGRTSGYVVRYDINLGPQPTDAYYVPRSSTQSTIIVESSDRSGVCENKTETLLDAFPAFQNDEAITGVPTEKPSIEYYIGVP